LATLWIRFALNMIRAELEPGRVVTLRTLEVWMSSTVTSRSKVTASGILGWQHDLSDGLALYGSIEADYTGDRSEVPLVVTATLQNINQVLMTLPSYVLTNLRLGLKGYRSNGDRWTASLFVDNLTNNGVLLDPQPQESLQTNAFTRFTMTQPLTAGIDVSYAFH
jgi:hypothetical protein